MIFYKAIDFIDSKLSHAWKSDFNQIKSQALSLDRRAYSLHSACIRQK